MTKREIILKLTALEGKKKQVDIAQISEIIHKLDMMGVLKCSKPKGVGFRPLKKKAKAKRKKS